MTFPFATTFLLAKENGKIEVYDCEYLELSKPIENGDISDTCESYVIRANIECNEKVTKLTDGTYECLLAGKWDWEDMGADWESGVHDYEVIFDISIFEIQEYIESDPDFMGGVESLGER